MSEACQSSIVVNCGAVREERIGVPQTVGMLVDSESTTQDFFHRIPVLPKSSVLFVSDMREVLIATPERLSRAVVAPLELIVASSKSVSHAFTRTTFRALLA